VSLCRRVVVLIAEGTGRMRVPFAAPTLGMSRTTSRCEFLEYSYHPIYDLALERNRSSRSQHRCVPSRFLAPGHPECEMPKGRRSETERAGAATSVAFFLIRPRAARQERAAVHLVGRNPSRRSYASVLRPNLLAPRIGFSI
jgi:hypothetical protein